MKLSTVNEFYLEHHQTTDPKELALVTELDIRTVRAALKRFAKQASLNVAVAAAPEPRRMGGKFDIKDGTVSMTPAQHAADDNLNRGLSNRRGRAGTFHVPFPGQPSQ